MPEMPALSLSPEAESALAGGYLSTYEVAERLKMDQTTIRRWIRDGKLPAYRIGESRMLRVAVRDLETLMRPVGA